jgi:hypothetical protein
LLAVGASGGDQYQLLGLPVGRRRQQNALNETENRRGCADAEGQGDDGDESKAGLLEQHPHAEPQVTQHFSASRGSC